MALGLGRLRLHPEVFWSSSPRELAAMAGLTGASRFGAADLAALMAAHPDAATPA